MLKVGIDKKKYTDVTFDNNKWADASKYSPQDFDLCDLKLKDNSVVVGWANGLNWDGLNYKKGQKVLFWKFKKDR